MPNEKNVFDRLDNLEVTTEANNKMLSEIYGALKSQNSQTSQMQNQTATQKPDPNAAFLSFAKSAIKYWRWFGDKYEFARSKRIATISLFLLLLVTVAETIITTISCGMYSAFSFFVGLWFIFGIIQLVFVRSVDIKEEMSFLASHSIISFEKDKYGAFFPRGEKKVFIVFRIISIVCALANIVFIWMNKSDYSILATIMQVLFIGIMIFVWISNLMFYSQYSIAYLEGKNFKTGEKVVLVKPNPNSKFMSEDEFKKMMPPLFKN